jgi:hypothetical protein
VKPNGKKYIVYINLIMIILPVTLRNTLHTAKLQSVPPVPTVFSSLFESWQLHSRICFILIPCIIDYVEINQLNALNYILLYFSSTMAPTCFGKTMPSSERNIVAP